ncbi:hypothetical protein T4E_5506 [Trichinella pseudospiralis]|uniref:Uncharacterized protein n=1 Tax=Trichinella pseudospiralis TaxID=6337 RepID=A0A0V0X6K9_TRIPS|nr:hypothetical protein T4E_5506 [Trichinella pseudospiralis]
MSEQSFWSYTILRPFLFARIFIDKSIRAFEHNFQ